MSFFKWIRRQGSSAQNSADLDADPFPAPDLSRYRDGARILRDDPLTLRAVRAAAASQNLSIDQYLQRDLERVLSSPYPTPACLGDEALVSAAEGAELSEADADHLLACDFCAGAIAGAGVPKLADFEHMLESVEALLQEGKADAQRLSRRSIGPTHSNPGARSSRQGSERIFDDNAIALSRTPLERPPFLDTPHEA